jgi:hypothetical protein
MTNREAARPPGRLWIRRTRGAGSGILLVFLGVWGALIPCIGLYFSFSFTPDGSWTWSAGRGWLEVLRGAVAALGGLLLDSGNRATVNSGPPVSVHYTAIPLNTAKPGRFITFPTNPDVHAFAFVIG